MRIKLSLTERRMIKRLLKRLKNDLGITDGEFADILNISKYKLKYLSLNPQSYYKVGSIDAIVDRGKKILGTRGFKKWVRSSPTIFNGRTPLDYLKTQEGYKIILHSLSVINSDSCA